MPAARDSARQRAAARLHLHLYLYLHLHLYLVKRVRLDNLGTASGQPWDRLGTTLGPPRDNSGQLGTTRDNSGHMYSNMASNVLTSQCVACIMMV